MLNTNDMKELALFRIGDALFGIDIVHIQEINKNLSFTQIFNVEKHIRGVLNLRGDIVTVIDLRIMFHRPASDENPDRRVIIINHADESVGLLVDSIDDIIYVEPERLETGATRMDGVNPAFFSGVYKLDEEVVIILDVDEILRLDEQYATAS